jgi:deazaflavin-dependent oxidoreductase (nitroreductase family)
VFVSVRRSGAPWFYADQLDPVAGAPEMNRPTTRSRCLWLLNNTVNRVTSEVARSRYGPFSLVRHVGRKSGRTYETPVILAKVPEGFIAELTYGDDVNWYRNITVAGECAVVRHRVEYRVNHIEPCSAERGLSAYPVPFRLVLKAGGRNEFRLLRTEHSQPRP